MNGVRSRGRVLSLAPDAAAVGHDFTVDAEDRSRLELDAPDAGGALEKRVEGPVVPTTIAGGNVPFSGGFYLRFHPRAFLDRSARRLNRNGHPVIYYVHPWEYDLAQPRMPLNALWRFFRYHRLAAMAPVTDALLGRGRFQAMEELAAPVRAGAQAPRFADSARHTIHPRRAGGP